VENGRDALELALAIQFDAVLMDVQMPEMDGLEATVAIREQEQGHIPIIGLTGHAADSDRQRCLDAGMDSVVSKPFRPEALFAAVEQVFSGLVDIESIPRRAARPADLIDRFEALDRLGGMPELAVELMQEFEKEYPNDLQLILTAFDEGDFERVSRIAHRMKGSLGLLSAHPACQAAALLERHAKEGITPHAETAWKLLQDEMESLGPVIAKLAGSAGAWA
jgi:CheY-like chemotaxis protein